MSSEKRKKITENEMAVTDTCPVWIWTDAAHSKVMGAYSKGKWWFRLSAFSGTSHHASPRPTVTRSHEISPDIEHSHDLVATSK